MNHRYPAAMRTKTASGPARPHVDSGFASNFASAFASICMSIGACLALSACSAEPGTPPAAAAATPVSMSIVVKGMHCEGCEGAICDKVGKIDGVASVKASHVDEKVDVTAPADRRDAIVAAIKKLGYEIEE
jgi:copper chaperone CopZ